MLTHISVRGAREHNLKGVNVEIPRESLTVITGLSGSGKISPRLRHHLCRGPAPLRRVACRAYARQFLEMMQKPDVEHIDGLSPAISIEQKTTSRNPRSTVATVTEIYDYMRLLWARVGVPYSPATGLPIEAQQVSQMVDRVMQLPEGSRHYLLAPVVRGRKGEYRKELAEWQKAGFTRVRIDGDFYDIEDAPALDKKYVHDIEVVVDRIVIREGIEAAPRRQLRDRAEAGRGPGLSRPGRSSPAREQRGAPSVAAALEAGPRAEAGFKLDYAAAGRITFSEKFACPVSGFTIAEIEPRLFCFNAPQGACPACDGLGEKLVFDEDLVVPNHSLSIAKGAVVPWAKSQPPSPLLHAGAVQPRPRLRLRPRPPRGPTCPRRPSDVILNGTKRPPGHPPLHRRPQVLRGQEAVRGRARQSEPPHAADRKRVDARGIVALPVEPPVRDLRRRPPPPRAALGQDRRRGHLAVDPPQRRRRARLVLHASRPSSPASSRKSPAPS